MWHCHTCPPYSTRLDCMTCNCLDTTSSNRTYMVAFMGLNNTGSTGSRLRHALRHNDFTVLCPEMVMVEEGFIQVSLLQKLRGGDNSRPHLQKSHAPRMPSHSSTVPCPDRESTTATSDVPCSAACNQFQIVNQCYGVGRDNPFHFNLYCAFVDIER